MSRQKHSIALGGLGGDSHSVGLILLRWALEKRGYSVVYLGTQNTIEDFFEVSPYVNIVMVSCMDGHARHYLRRFPEYINERRSGALWYLGGNPAVEELIGGERNFLEMGFSRVFLKFVDLDRVFDVIARDLSVVKPTNTDASLLIPSRRRAQYFDTVPDAKVALADHDLERREVLQHWPTGKGAIDMAENAHVLKDMPNLARYEQDVHEGSCSVLVQARTGVALPEKQLELFRGVISGGADVVSFQIDSLTRNNNYAGAAEGIRESLAVGYSTLNGYPAVNHGVRPLRKIAQCLDVPLQFRHSTRDPRLLAEIAFAGGVTAYEGGSICYNIPYYPDYPIEASIPVWQYVDRLCGRYFEEFGIVIHREFFGVLTGTLVPPSIAIATGIAEAILAAQQGVRAVAIGFAETGARYQDVATLRIIRKVSQRYLKSFGFDKVQVGAIFNQYMAAFPLQLDKARSLIEGSGTTAQLGRATRMLTKTAVEAIKIPNLADNLEGIALNIKGIRAAEEVVLDEVVIEAEAELIERETTMLVDRVIELGKGNIADGVVKAFATGTLDVPYSPSSQNAGRVMTARDMTGAIRILNPGSLPLSKDILAYHSERLAERRRRENIDPREDYKLIERDLLRIARGQFERWPLDSATNYSSSLSSSIIV